MIVMTTNLENMKQNKPYRLSPLQEQSVRELKRTIHRNPELSWKEYDTTKLIRKTLEELPGIDITDSGLDTGICAVLTGGRP
jgi:metal-dependent amidase/aminoacylase/carboxypeptidase family protein